MVNYKIMKKITPKLIARVILIFLFSIIIISILGCGARKSKATKIETEIKKDLVIDVKNNVIKITKIEEDENEVVETTTYNPVNPDKPSKVNDEEFINTSIEKKKSILKKYKKEDSKSTDLTEKKIIDTVKETVKVKEKETDKKQFNYFQLLWLLIPIGIIIFLLKKYTKILPF